MKNSKRDNPESVVIAKSPTGRYVCYNDVVGRGAYKIVYKGYDKHEGKEVAWNMVKFSHLNELEMDMIIDEVMLLKTLSPQNKYIINFHNAWIDEENGQLNFITGLALSGTLKKYIERIDFINMRVIKKWCNQILQGINFLHQQHIAHRDLKCNNIFINSNTGDILIGDLGLAKKRNTKFHSTIGTPEYMAPEMYEEETSYDEKVDIYAFGMCFLEMITKKIPYSECTGIGNIFKKVTSNCKPDSLKTVKNQLAKRIIEQCLNKNPNERPSALELLNMDFFKNIVDDDNDSDLVLQCSLSNLQTDNDKILQQSTQIQQQTAKQPPLKTVKSMSELINDGTENPFLVLKQSSVSNIKLGEDDGVVLPSSLGKRKSSLGKGNIKQESSNLSQTNKLYNSLSNIPQLIPQTIMTKEHNRTLSLNDCIEDNLLKLSNSSTQINKSLTHKK